ncbi:colanic acid biosynthesis pyruvyl transferase WcaK [Paraglaciecola sp. 20A4]|uniref:colanic acid biosynthesis pyruvyl transferase WcaK n=1 Tax=Paraglaciecola sp. 20A4 TaxID=2687288 RepID=UPI00140DE14E|nr:colanic acid biosynthesis pyruvyl transferase WcaK [Paraglaciecola sp. 20A4]
MKVLLVGNHTCGNRGDAAILRGLIASLKVNEPSIELTLVTRFPTSSEYLLGESFLPDTLHQFHSKRVGGIKKRFQRYFKKTLSENLHERVKNKNSADLPPHIQEYLTFLKPYDAVIQVGGSFFVDLYGSKQFEHSLCALIAGKPLFLLGHSVGPFQDDDFNKIAKTVFSQAQDVSLRESVSKDLMVEAGLMSDKVSEGADTAWLVPTSHDMPANYTHYFAQRPVVAITLRELKPFDKRLGIKQADYETAFAELAKKLIADGFDILALSTCTGIDSYTKDDRMVAFRVQKLVADDSHFNVVMDEVNDVELGVLLSGCKLTIGTRLHSAIISKNFGTAAIALNYEHKSLGIMQQLGLNDFSRTVHSLFDDTLYQFAKSLLVDNKLSEYNVEKQVQLEREKADKMIVDCIAKIKAF